MDIIENEPNPSHNILKLDALDLDALNKLSFGDRGSVILTSLDSLDSLTQLIQAKLEAKFNGSRLSITVGTREGTTISWYDRSDSEDMKWALYEHFVSIRCMPDEAARREAEELVGVLRESVVAYLMGSD